MKVSKTLAVVILAISASLISFAAIAHCHYCHYRKHFAMWVYYPVAYCTQYNTNQPLPMHVCCKLGHKVSYKKHGVWHHYWRNEWSNKWVANSCKAADSRATGSFGCTPQSELYGTDHPIIASCQFSTIKDGYGHRSW